LDAINNAIQSNLGREYSNLVYKEHALEIGAGSRAISYIGITGADGTRYWGCGIDPDIMTSSIKALFSAVNNMGDGRSANEA
jgi:2-isopropylmalate synthase